MNIVRAKAECTIVKNKEILERQDTLSNRHTLSAGAVYVYYIKSCIDKASAQ